MKVGEQGLPNMYIIGLSHLRIVPIYPQQFTRIATRIDQFFPVRTYSYNQNINNFLLYTFQVNIWYKALRWPIRSRGRCFAVGGFKKLWWTKTADSEAGDLKMHLFQTAFNKRTVEFQFVHLIRYRWYLIVKKLSSNNRLWLYCSFYTFRFVSTRIVP